MKSQQNSAGQPRTAGDQGQVPLEIIISRAVNSEIDRRIAAANEPLTATQAIAKAKGPSPDEAPNPEIDRELRQMRQHIADLEDMASSLIDRLIPMSRQMPITTATGISSATAGAPSSTMVGGDLADMRGRVSIVIDRLHDAKTRLEI